MNEVLALCGRGDMLYSLIGALILVIIGFALITKAGNKLGWIFVIAAFVWAYQIVQPVIRDARATTTPEQSRRGYYRTPGGNK